MRLIDFLQVRFRRLSQAGRKAAGLAHAQILRVRPSRESALCILMPSAVLLSILSLVFWRWTATSVWSFPRFLAAVLFLIYIPGRLPLDICRLNMRPADHFVLSLVLGMSLSGLVYQLLAPLGPPPYFLIWPVAAAAVFICRTWTRRVGIGGGSAGTGGVESERTELNPRSRNVWSVAALGPCLDFGGPSAAIRHLSLAALILLGLVPFAFLPWYYRSLVLMPHKLLTFVRLPDHILHLAIANELTHSIPPQVPFLAGLPLSYHWGMDLVAAMFSNCAGIGVPDLTVRFLPTFFMATTVLAVYCCARAWLGSHWLALLTCFLVLFGEDFSFIPGVLLGGRIWCAQFFGVPTTFSLYFMNPMLAALAWLFTGLYCLERYTVEGAKPWLLFAAFLFAASAHYKLFVSLHVLAALFVAGIVIFLRHRDTRLFAVLILTGVFIAPWLLNTWHKNAFGGNIWVRIDPYPYASDAFAKLASLWTSTTFSKTALLNGPWSFDDLLLFLIIALPLYLFGSLGGRSVALPAILRECLSTHRDTIHRFFLSVFVIVGFLLTMVLRVTPREFPSDYNNSVWFYVQSKYVVWIFAAGQIASWLRGSKPAVRAAVFALLIAMAVPSTLQFFYNHSTRGDLPVLDAATMEMIDFFSAKAKEGKVVLSRQPPAMQLLALTRCRVPLGSDVYLSSFASASELDRRSQEIEDFWKGLEAGRIRDDILEKYGTNYVLADKQDGAGLILDRSAKAGDAAFSGLVSGQPVFENDRFRVYEVSRHAP